MNLGSVSNGVIELGYAGAYTGPTPNFDPNINMGSSSGNDIEMGYTGAYTGTPAQGIASVASATQYQQSVVVDTTGITETIVGGTLGGIALSLPDSDTSDNLITFKAPGSLVTGLYELVLNTASAVFTYPDVSYTQTHPDVPPQVPVDSNSAFVNQLYLAEDYFKISSPFANGTIIANPDWANDIADNYTPNPGFVGTDTATFEMLYADGTTASWAVSVEVVHVYNIIAPYEIVDDNSAFFGQVFDDGTLSRIVTPPSHGVIDVERANNENLWGDDIALIYTPTAGFEGDDSFTMQEKYPNGDIGVVRTVSMVVSSTSAEFSISETIEIVVSATSSKVAKMGIEETVTLTPSVSFKKLAYASLSESLEISEDVTFRSLRYVEAERDVAFDSAATLANEVITHLFAVTEAVSFTVDSTFQVPYTIVPSGVSAGGFTDITSKSSHILTSGEEQEIIPVTQNSWRQLEFPITVNGEAPSDVSGLNFTMYLDGQIFKVFERGSELAYIDGAIFLVLDETFTATLSKYNYQFELWFTDSEDNSFFVMQGEMQIKHTQASFL